MSDIDDKLAAAWRDANREEPSAVLDDALRAAARRAIGAGPSRVRHMHSWPLAAAAIVAVISIGIVHMAPPEQVTPTVVANSALQAAAVKQTVAIPPPEARAAPVATNATLGASEQVATPAPVDRMTSAPRTQLEPLANAPPPNSTVALADKPQPAPGSSATSLAAGTIAQSPARDSGATESKLETAAQADLTKKSHAEPFPGASVEAKNDADGITAAPPYAAAKTALSPPPENAIDARVARSDQKQLAETTPPVQTARYTSLASERDRAKDAAPRTPDEWIKLIRRLQGEGRKDDVSRELAAFRVEYKDRADTLLPPDLREIK
jgi:hypothetical protein